MEVITYDCQTKEAKVLSVEHGDMSGLLGRSIVAIVEGDVCPPGRECAWCTALSRRIISRTGTKNIIGRIYR